MPADILVIEDNVANLELMLYLLRAFGHRAEGRADGLRGVEAALENRRDLVLTDVLMPGIDGFGVAERFKSEPRLRETRLVAVTALAMVGDRERIIAAGFDGYISKPIDPETFVAQVDAHLPFELRSAPRGRAKAPSAPEERAPKAPVATILIADDRAHNRRLIVDVITSAGYASLEAADGVRALELALERSPDAIVTDLSMPELDGVELLRALRRDPRTASTPIVLYTASTGGAPMRDFMALYDIRHVIEKPAEPQAILATIAAVLAPAR
ncbi:MAG TPA: response regulator [Verrucomicrobiae bacterium]|nr:response regulator [Verrucomicrobiae bacterium]